jgi:hypothetical protein
MRLARKLFLLTAMALAAMALTAGAANAQEEPVEITNETIEHCSVAAENCQLHVVGTSSLTLFIGGVSQGVISACTDEFLATLGEDGDGFIYHGDYNNVDEPLCTRIQCNDSPGEDWAVSDVGEYMGSEPTEGHLRVTFCLDLRSNPAGAGTTCTAEIQLSNLGSHKYGFAANGVVCPITTGVHVVLNGSWQSEAAAIPSEGTDVEIIH